MMALWSLPWAHWNVVWWRLHRTLAYHHGYRAGHHDAFIDRGRDAIGYHTAWLRMHAAFVNYHARRAGLHLGSLITLRERAAAHLGNDAK